ncbi:MAG: ribonuclease HI [Candidatus Zambryskibacteria bacterium]|nr:ribonuclease HI [Candidatus Zambryskibacteria bacterium]
MITIYTDGSSRGNPGPGGWGVIVAYGKKHESGGTNQEWISELGGREALTTNNRMELTAAIEALKYLDSRFVIHDSVVLHTDSEYMMKGITEWIHNWQKKNWKTANRKPVLNQDLWQKLVAVMKDKKIEWQYVAGHTGVRLNERADEIATSFADNLNPSLYHGPKDNYR